MTRKLTRTKVVLIAALGALLLGLIPSSSAPGGRAGAASGNLGEPVPIDIAAISNVPEVGWGVAGLDQPITTNIPNVVWDITQIGDRYYVAGAFTHVKASENATGISQPYLAAFNIHTGVWDSGFTPVLDGPAFALEVSPLGDLLVGGEFQSVSGQPNTAGIVSLNPSTGAINPNFQASVERPWTTDIPVVRTLEVVGVDLYMGGNFSHVRGSSNSQRTRVYNAARIKAKWGTPDAAWKPQVTGGAVWSLAVDTSRNRVSLAGWFSAVNGFANTASFNTVNTASGATVWLTTIPRNSTLAPEMYATEYANDKVWAGGSQHVTYVLGAGNHDLQGYHTTGMVCDGLYGNQCGYLSGGDTQVLVKAGDVVFSGCHCLAPFMDGQYTHYSSYTTNRTAHAFAMAYNANTGRLIPSFVPDLGVAEDGIWAIHTTTNGCVLLGGQFERGGYTTGSSYWVGNIARLCEPQAPLPVDLIDLPEDLRSTE